MTKQVTVSPKGITRLVLEGLVPLVKFQEQFNATPQPRLERSLTNAS